jgi:prolyl-tRNA editing enzyme YbaK/EbsC (Cys-tRNA(Pro) deacylase)
MEESIAALQKIYINGGSRGYLIGTAPTEIIRVLKPVMIKVGI